MDLLQQELLKKRQSLVEDTGGKRFFKRSEIEQKQIQKLREEEKREQEAKLLRQKAATSTPNAAATKSNNLSTSTITSSTNTTTSAATTSKSLTNEQNIDNLVLPKQEVIRRLRLLKQPITLFGEDDNARLERLKYVLKAGLFEVDSDMTEGQTNDFLRDIVELRKRQKTGILSERKRKDREEGKEDGEGGGDEELSGDGGSSGVDMDKDLKRMKTNFDELCEEDKILVFFKRLLNEWNQELDEMPDAEKRTAKGKSMVATFKQCARYLNPLFKFCRKKVCVLMAIFYLNSLCCTPYDIVIIGKSLHCRIA